MSHIEKRRNLWYATLKVPEELQGRVGRTKYLKSLGTADKRRALLLAPPIIAMWKAELRQAAGQSDAVHEEAELKPYRERIAARRKKNPHSPAWGILGQRWGTVVEAAEKTLAAHSRGQAAVRGDVLAAGHIQRLALEAPPEAVIDTALAMFLLREARPHRFKSDRAFNFELVRRVRALAESNAGTYFDQPSGKVKRVYRDILPGTMERLAVSLTDAFGSAGLQLAALDQRDEERRAAEGAKLMAALKDLA